MELKKLRLRGFTGIKRGLGLEEISIDFSNVTGLAAFAGANGLGKSTVLENLHPYNTLASREGALFNHVSRRDSEKELCFEYNGHDYKTLIKIDCQSGKSEGFIWKDGESLVNGKISAYSKYITEVFGSSNLFFNSVFCAQNATKLSDMTTGQLKSLFAEFLRLDRLQGYEETSKQVINVLSGKVSQIDVNIAALQKRLEGASDLQGEIKRLTSVKAERETYKDDLSAQLVTAQEEREKLREIIARNEVLTKQIEEMETTLRSMEGNRRLEEAENESTLVKLRTQYKDIANEITHIEAVLKDEAAIYAAVENEKALKTLIETIVASIENAMEAVTETQVIVTTLEKEIQESKHSLKDIGNDAKLTELDRNILQITQEITGYSDQLNALEGRDRSCTSSTCSFIFAARKAEGELSVAQDRLAQLKIVKENRMSELTASATKISGQLSEKENLLKQTRSRLIDLQNIQNIKRKQLAEKRLELNRYQNLAAKQSEIAVAKSKKEDRVKALEENKKQGQTVAEAWKTKKQTLDGQITAHQNRINEITTSINVKAADTLDVINCRIESTANQIVETDRRISETTAKISKLQGELSGITEAETQLQKVNEDKCRIQADIADWTYLRNACGKNGLQAMEIDGAAPIITGFANDLLSQAFGSLYTVKFQTQDENGKECLDIITIADDGEEVLLENLSGGQRVWVLMALRLAMTLLSKEKGGRNFETAFFDEMDGALDSDNAVNFVNLYKSFMQIGHFSTIPFISHKPECRSMADHVLMFEPGKNPYWN